MCYGVADQLPASFAGIACGVLDPLTATLVVLCSFFPGLVSAGGHSRPWCRYTRAESSEARARSRMARARGRSLGGLLCFDK